MKLNCFDRKIEIFLYLCRHRKANTRDLAREFSVSLKTIIRDIMILSKYVPLYTKFGRYGGVFIMDRSRAPRSENCRVLGIGVAVRVRVSTEALS